MATTKVRSPKKKSSPPKLRDFKLRALLEITKAINKNQSAHKLFQRFEEILKNELLISKLMLYRFEDKVWKCDIKYGIGEGSEQIDVERDLLHIKEISTVTLGSNPVSASFEIAVPVYHKTIPLAYVLIGDLEDNVGVSPAIKHLPFIQTLTNIIIGAVENKRLAKANLKQAAIRRELQLASEMQNMLFPEELPDNEKLQIDALYQPHQQVGGDYYDYMQINEEEVMFCMADVSGKGVSAALLMANFQANLRALVAYSSSLTQLIKGLNTKVNLNAKGEKFITFFIAKYNLRSRLLQYVNAGHNPPVLHNGHSFNKLSVGCTGLGMFDSIEKIKEGIITIENNALLTCYTDGVVELENKEDEQFGLEELERFVKDNLFETPSFFNATLLSDLIKYKGRKPYVDDIALLTCRFL